MGADTLREELTLQLGYKPVTGRAHTPWHGLGVELMSRRL